MTKDLPAYVPDPGTDVGFRAGAPRRTLVNATFLASIPSLLVGGFLVVAISVSMLRGDEDEWGIGPFFLGVGLVLVALAVAGIALAKLGERAERRTSTRSVWSVLGLGLAIVAAVPSGLIFLLIR